jgi:hypothetical protein
MREATLNIPDARCSGSDTFCPVRIFGVNAAVAYRASSSVAVLLLQRRARIRDRDMCGSPRTLPQPMPDETESEAITSAARVLARPGRAQT